MVKILVDPGIFNIKYNNDDIPALPSDSQFPVSLAVQVEILGVVEEVVGLPGPLVVENSIA